MENSGTAGATSVWKSSVPKYAFQNSENRGIFYHSNRVSNWPTYIWMKFAKPHRISQLGFSSRNNKYAPRRFDIVGSSNCADPWTVLHHVADSGYPNDGSGYIFKTWIVPQQNRQAFPCIGLKVETVWHMQYPYVLLTNIQMWEEVVG